MTTAAARALAALAIDPGGLGGLVLRTRVGPARGAFENALTRLPGEARRIHPAISDSQLFGGLNIAASLAEGRPVSDPGLIDMPCRLILTMAERTGPGLAARLARILDGCTGHCLVALDEGATAEEAVPRALADRLAFHIEPDEGRAKALLLPAPADIDAARARLSQVKTPQDTLPALTALAARFGIESLRAPLFALRAARALAALDGAEQIIDAHLQEAAELVYPARATQIPHAPEPEPDLPEDQPPPTPDQSDQDDQGAPDIPEEILVRAIAALLPADILERSAGRSRTAASGSGAGNRRAGNRRGRPLPPRSGRPNAQARIDTVATLRAAAPWQTLRRTGANKHRAVIIHPSDIRLKRYEDRSDRLLIFAVDASGSAAVARLNEAKGAVELMLAQAYARRDQVALIAFRGDRADELLPPTRSLVQAKRQLASLPGGGGTPLAAGLVAVTELARHATGRGLTPMLVLLTDGRANIPLSGEADRKTALEDAETIAAGLNMQGIAGVLIDTSNRPADQAQRIAARLGARYIALPRADARVISTAVSEALDS
ncbi:magnesium chelatase subunit D [Roseovarius aestuariivivens]|uniref:magnesium chelatase subunit D n=1 Tax=Roseovarius aestuariivivens TaxID=1888910 RepID=UPI001080FEF9|nr:magnesium chelatase subunit D [Roseovarius aestuariivivens]